MVWTATKLKLIQRHCLAVICSDAPKDRRIFEVGTACHSILEGVQRATNEAGEELDPIKLREVCLAMVTAGAEHGRSYRGQSESPLRPDAYPYALDLVLSFLDRYPIDPGMEPEMVVTIDRWGEPVEYDDPNAWFSGILDLSIVEDVVGDDDHQYRRLRVRDYKSDWNSKDEALMSLQMRAYTLLAAARHKDEQFGAIAWEIASLPRRWIYSQELQFEEIGILEQWREELYAITSGYDSRIGKYGLDPEELASPGVACKECPAFGSCRPGRKWLENTGSQSSPEQMALQLAALRAETWRLESLLKPIVADLGEIVAGETVVGYRDKSDPKLAKDAAKWVWLAWRAQARELSEQKDRDRVEKELLQQFFVALIIGKTALSRLLSGLWPTNRGKRPEREAKKTLRADLIDQCVTDARKPQFGVWRKRQPEAEKTLEELLPESIDATV